MKIPEKSFLFFSREQQLFLIKIRVKFFFIFLRGQCNVFNVYSISLLILLREKNFRTSLTFLSAGGNE